MSVVLWRIAQETREFPADDLSGEGAAKTGGRWNSISRPVVYTSRTVALAYLETMAHLGREAPRDRFLVRVVVPDKVWDAALWAQERDLRKTWRAEPAGMGSVVFGDKWLAGGKSVLLCVPSAIVPEDTNVLINPLHGDFSSIQARVHRQVIYDPRLLRV